MSTTIASTQPPPYCVADARAAASRREHLGAVDWLRLVGITGVVYYHAADIWYHDAPGAGVAFSGLHALTAAAAYFAAASRSSAAFSQVVVRRFNRLIVPWLVFSCLHMAMALRSGKFETWMLWMGGAMHLWFLPFIFLVGCAIALGRRQGFIVRGEVSAVFWTAAALALAAVEPWIGPRLPGVNGPWQVINALPSALFGVAIYALPEGRNRVASAAQIIAIAVLAVVLAVLGPANAIEWPAAVAFGTLLFAAARLVPMRSSPASDFVGRTSFGVYLLHPIILTVIVRGLARFTHAGEASHLDAYGLVVWAQVALTVVACMAIVAVLERTPLRRFVG